MRSQSRSALHKGRLPQADKRGPGQRTRPGPWGRSSCNSRNPRSRPSTRPAPASSRTGSSFRLHTRNFSENFCAAANCGVRRVSAAIHRAAIGGNFLTPSPRKSSPLNRTRWQLMCKRNGRKFVAILWTALRAMRFAKIRAAAEIFFKPRALAAEYWLAKWAAALRAKKAAGFVPRRHLGRAVVWCLLAN